MTIVEQCFKKLSEAKRPMPSKELAKIIGHRQTRGSIESVLYKYCPKYLRKVPYDCGDGCRTAWVFVKFPEYMRTESAKRRNYSNGVRNCIMAMKESNVPLTSPELAALLGHPGEITWVTPALEKYVKEGYIKKVPYRWSSYGKIGYMLVKMPRKFA